MVGKGMKAASETRHPIGAALLYGAFLMCTSVLLWGGYLGALPDSFGSTYRAAGFFACGFAFAFGFFIVAACAYVRPAARAWRHPLVAFALVVCAGLLLAAQVRMGTGGVGAGALTGAMLGLASAFFFCGLQEMVAGMRVLACGVVVFAAAAACSALYLLVNQLPRDTVVWIVLFACLPACAISYCAAQRRAPATRPHPMFQSVPANNRGKLAAAALDLWRPLLCVSFSALLIGIIRADTLIDDGALASVNDVGMAGLFVAAIVLLALWRIIYERTLLSKVQLLIFPLIATSFLLLPFLSGVGRGGFIALAFSVFSITSSLMVVTCARAARMYAVQPVLVYGVFAGVVYLFLACGAWLSFALGGLSGMGTLWLFALALVAIYVLSMALTMGRRAPEGTRCARAGSEASRAGMNVRAFAGKGRAFSIGAADAAGQMADASERAVGATGSSSRVRTDLSGDGADANESARDAGERCFADWVDLGGRCTALAERFGLTVRETEVMTLLAHGRDVAFIAEELVISKNTVRTHVKGVFSKTGVHSKQELIDLVYLFEI